MSAVSVPNDVREQVRQRLWDQAEAIGWSDLSAVEKTRHYESWTHDPTVGGVLARYMEPPRVRVYLKDAIFKPYARARLDDWARCGRALGVVGTNDVIECYIKPHGRRLHDGRVICWGRASTWKVVLMALHERTHGRQNLRAHAAVLLRATGRYREDSTRHMVEDAARRLGIERLIWLDT